MKRIHFWANAIVAFALISLFGCEKDRRQDFSISGTNHPDSSKVYIPVRMNDSNSTTSYNYQIHDAGTLTTVTKQDNRSDTIYSVYEIAYNTLNRPMHFSSYVNGVGISQTQYILNANGEVIKGEVYNVKTENDPWWGDFYVPTTLKSYYTLTYNTLKRLSQVSYYHANGEKDHDEYFEYTSDGNISRIHSPGTINIEYDNFNGIGKSVKNAHLFYIESGDALLFYNRNNPTKLNEISRSYKYNIDKYPIEMTIIHPDGNNVFNIEYRLK